MRFERVGISSSFTLYWGAIQVRTNIVRFLSSLIHRLIVFSIDFKISRAQG